MSTDPTSSFTNSLGCRDDRWLTYGALSHVGEDARHFGTYLGAMPTRSASRVRLPKFLFRQSVSYAELLVDLADHILEQGLLIEVLPETTTAWPNLVGFLENARTANSIR